MSRIYFFSVQDMLDRQERIDYAAEISDALARSGDDDANVIVLVRTRYEGMVET